MSADKDEIRDRSDIVEIVSTSVTLQKKGRNFVGLCPFHQEKTPSFNVDPQTRTFICFGCGEKGDVFTFVQKQQNMSFVEAAEFLAKRAGLSFERKGSMATEQQISQREQIYEINATAARFFQNTLDRASFARDYLRERGLNPEAINRFQIGYAPDKWEEFVVFLRANRKDLRIAELAGLVRPGTTSSFIDAFRHRIMFPIHDEQMRVVGFGGRAFGDDQPKYLNTGETPVFNKSRLLYGLPFARKKIGEDKQTLLMEGYMDVVAAHQAGFVSAVATLGTSLADEHAKKLARLAPTVVLVYDADSAGVKATLRASEILEKEELQVRVVRLPAGDDPDSLLKRGESAAFQKAIDTAIGRVEYQLDRIIAEADQETDAGKEQMLRKIVAILASVRTRSARDVYVNKVWKLHPMSGHGPSVASEQLHRDAEAYAAGRKRASGPVRKTPSGPAPKETNQRIPNVTTVERAERELIRALADDEWRLLVLKTVVADDFATPIGRRFREFVEQNLPLLQSEEATLVDVLNSHADEDFSLAVRQLLQEINAQMEKVPVTTELIHGCAATIRQHRKERLIQERAQILQGKPVLGAEDRDRVDQLMRMVRELKGSDGTGPYGPAAP